MAYSNPFPNVSTSQALQVISYRESGNQNIYNYLHSSNPNYYTAGGYYQITNSTWQNGAQLAGVDTSMYPTAISAPPDVQTKVATALYNQYGFSPWQGNPKSAADMATLNSGGTLSYVSDTSSPVSGSANTGTLASNTGNTGNQGFGSNGADGWDTSSGPYTSSTQQPLYWTGTDATTGAPAAATDPTSLRDAVPVYAGQTTTTGGTTTTVSPSGGTSYSSTPSGSGNSSLLGAEAGYTPPASTGGPSTVGLAPGVASQANTIAQNAVNTFTSGVGGWLQDLQNELGRMGLIIVAVVLLLVALWRIMDPQGTKLTTAMKAAA